MQGRTAEASAIRFDKSNAGIESRLSAEALKAQKDFDKASTESARTEAYNRLANAQAGQQRLDKLRDLVIAQAGLNELEVRASTIRANASAEEERAAISANLGATGELESLSRIGAIRAKEVEDLSSIVEKYTAIANKADDKRMIAQAQAMQVELEKLAASADVLRDKFQQTFSNAFGNFFQDLASGTTSVKDAFKGLFKDLQAQFLKFATDDLFKKLFSKEGGGGGVVDFVTSLFGPQGQSTAGTGAQPQAQATPSLLSGGAVQAAAGAFAGGGSAGSAAKGAEAAAALTGLAESTTVSTFALKEFADNGLASATGSLFENVTASTAESAVSEAATGSLTSLTLAAEAAAAALSAMAANAAISGAVSGAGGIGKADGGQVIGAGTGTSDSIPHMLSNEEFVVRAKSTKERGAVEFLKRFNKYGMAALRNLSTGGLVGRTFAMPSAAGNLQIAGGSLMLTQNFTVQANTPRETQQQFASAAYQGGVRAYQRNR